MQTFFAVVGVQTFFTGDVRATHVRGTAEADHVASIEKKPSRRNQIAVDVGAVKAVVVLQIVGVGVRVEIDLGVFSRQ